MIKRFISLIWVITLTMRLISYKLIFLEEGLAQQSNSNSPYIQ